MGNLTQDAMKYMIGRLLDNANDALAEAEENKGDPFYSGKSFAYYEMLDTLKNDLDIYEEDLKEYGLDIDLDKMGF